MSFIIVAGAATVLWTTVTLICRDLRERGWQ